MVGGMIVFRVNRRVWVQGGRDGNIKIRLRVRAREEMGGV